MSENVVVWIEGDWRCVFYPGFGAAARLEVYFGEYLVTSEETPSGDPASRRAEVLRQRVVRGDLRAV